MPYWLFSQTKITGSFQIAAMLSDSWKAPSLLAPSPKKQTVTSSRPRRLAASAAPTAIGRPPPTMPLAPRLPLVTSAMCIEPPRPWQ